MQLFSVQNKPTETWSGQRKNDKQDTSRQYRETGTKAQRRIGFQENSASEIKQIEEGFWHWAKDSW